ncbi:MAG: OmpH family outer membrane protein, partial [Muribaculaceae bacterium]|nr:OmpH family outer membrane protein [Muribaculaceae bacterium]
STYSKVMFKKILLAVAVALPMCAAAQLPKFGTVEVETVFQAMPETQAATTQIEEASKKYEGELAKLQEEFNKKYTELQTLDKDTATPQSIKERRMQELTELNDKIQQFRQTASQDLQRQQQTLMAPIQERIITAIKAVGQENNFTFILTNDQPVYIGADVVDVTPMVKAKLGLQ